MSVTDHDKNIGITIVLSLKLMFNDLTLLIATIIKIWYSMLPEFQGDLYLLSVQHHHVHPENSLYIVNTMLI